MGKDLLHYEITSEILRAYYRVYNFLGYGFLEKVYHNALLFELANTGLRFENRVPIEVHYKGVQVGFYNADIVVEGKVIIEIKAAEALRKEHEAQLLNYLKATDIRVGMLLNFGKEAEFRRRII